MANEEDVDSDAIRVVDVAVTSSERVALSPRPPESVSKPKSPEAKPSSEAAAAPGDASKRQPSSRTQDQPEEEEEEELATISDAAEMITAVMIPVAITMAIVVIAVRVMNIGGSASGSVRPIYYAESPDDSAGQKFVGALVNALIFLAIILATTVAFVVLYFFRCIKLIVVWLVASTVLLLGMIGMFFFALILQALNAPLDYVSFALLLWNFAVTGVISIFWVAPLFMNRAFLIAVSVLVASYFTQLPEWTTWAILVVVACYDIFAVLCPKGPLRVLVDLAQKRQEPIPALLYNAAAFFMMAEADAPAATAAAAAAAPSAAPKLSVGSARVADSSSSAALASAPAVSQAVPQDAPAFTEQKQRGIKLGLGDFVFYSVLMGRAALFDVLTVATCFVAILTGLFGTLLLLGILRKALPALPISIALGVLFYFLSRIFLLPFVVVNGVCGLFV